MGKRRIIHRVSLDTALLLVFSCHFRDTALGAVLQKRQKEAPDSERRLKKDRFMANRGLIGKFMLLPFSLDFLTVAARSVFFLQ